MHDVSKLINLLGKKSQPAQICVKNVATGTIAVIKNLLQKRFEVFGEIGEISVIRLQNEAYVTFNTTAAATKINTTASCHQIDLP